jgi:hypothetical protein
MYASVKCCLILSPVIISPLVILSVIDNVYSSLLFNRLAGLGNTLWILVIVLGGPSLPTGSCGQETDNHGVSDYKIPQCMGALFISTASIPSGFLVPTLISKNKNASAAQNGTGASGKILMTTLALSSTVI